MVRLLLTNRKGSTGRAGATRATTILVGVAFLLATTLAMASKRPKPTIAAPLPPDLLMDGGRKLSFERSFSLEREVKPKRSFWTRVVDVIAGEPDFHYLVSPYSVVTDSKGRIIVTDVAAAGVHIFDFDQQKYKFISRRDAGKDPMLTPQCAAVDAQDNIYVTDSQSGKIFVFDANGKYRRAIGSLKGGEGYFKRPTGIAVDSAAQRIYVSGHAAQQDLRHGYAGQRAADDRQDGHRRRRVQLSHRVAVARAGSGGGRCHEFPRAGVRPLRARSATPSANRETARDGSFVRKGSASTPNRISTSSTGSGAWCRSSTSRGNCCITSAGREPGRSSFNCRPDCRSTITIASTWWIPSTGASRCFTTTGSRRRRTRQKPSHDNGVFSRYCLASFFIVAQSVCGSPAAETCWACTTCRCPVARPSIRREAWAALSAMLRTADWAATHRYGTRSCRRNPTCLTAARPIPTWATLSPRWVSPAVCA